MNKKLMMVAFGCAMINHADIKTESLADLLARRHSGYSYDATRPVSQKQLKAIVKAGQLAPSSFNDQPWFFIICDKATHPEAFNKVLSTLVEFNQQWAQNAPILIVVAAGINSHKGNPNRWAHYDTGAAALSMVLQATSLGLMAHQMGGFDEAKISKLFSMPNDVVPMAVMALGYPAANDTKSPAKERKPSNNNFFMGTWGNGFNS